MQSGLWSTGLDSKLLSQREPHHLGLVAAGEQTWKELVGASIQLLLLCQRILFPQWTQNLNSLQRML